MKTLEIKYPNGEAIAVLPVPRDRLCALEQLMVEIQSYWIEDQFSTADTIARHEVWAKMQQVAELLPTQVNASVCWGKGGLDAIANDYEQLELLFFGDYKGALDHFNQFNVSQFAGASIYDLHRYNPKKKIQDAGQLERERNPIEELSPKTSRSKAAA